MPRSWIFQNWQTNIFKLQYLLHQQIRLQIITQHKFVAAAYFETVALIKAQSFIVMFPNAKPYIFKLLIVGYIKRKIHELFADTLAMMFAGNINAFNLCSIC